MSIWDNTMLLITLWNICLALFLMYLVDTKKAGVINIFGVSLSSIVLMGYLLTDDITYLKTILIWSVFQIITNGVLFYVSKIEES